MSKQLVAFVLFWGFTLFRIPVPAVGDIRSGKRCTAQDSPLRNELRTTTTCSDHGAAVSFTTVSNTQETSVDYVCTLEGSETITRSPWTQRTSNANVPFTVSVAEQLQPGTNCTFYVCYWYYASHTPVFGRESPASCITDTDECATNNGGCESNCINTIGSYNCSCPTGYYLDEDGFNCNDTDECAINNGGCEVNCVNTIGSFHCSCPTGYHLDEDGFNCNETNECATNNGGCEQLCNNTIGSFYCSCRTGYLLDGNGFNCSDINECENGDDNCHENANCTNTEGSFTCSCNPGYAGDGVICTNINECNTDNGGCEHNCTDTIGSFNCSCDIGYLLDGNGFNCSDTNECATNNGGCEQMCNNVIGSFYCSCWTGYLLDGNGFNCSDINECENGDDNCHENANCTNTERSFTCSCNPGYAGDGVICTDINECNTDNGARCEHSCTDTIGSFKCNCNIGYLLDGNGFNCSDTDECTTNNGGCEQMCNNTIGNFYCSCRTGYLLDGNGFNCSDINECENGDNNCHESATCTNTEGNFICSCNPGYAGDGVICTNINECDTDNGGCEHNCTDTIGSFNCSCDVGYLLDGNGLNCSDINECENGDNSCNENANCTNTEGSFTCSCNPGYAGDGVICTNINECNTDNGGCEHSCTDTIGSFNCSCDVGYLLDGNGLNCIATMIPVIAVVVTTALLIAVLCVVFCAVQQFRKKDTLFEISFNDEVIDLKYYPVSTEVTPKLYAVSSIASLFDNLRTTPERISDTDTSESQAIDHTNELLDTVLHQIDAPSPNVVVTSGETTTGTANAGYAVPKDTTNGSFLVTETGISSATYFSEDKEESLNLEGDAQSDGRELAFSGCDNPVVSDAHTVSHTSVIDQPPYVISEDLLVGSHRPLCTFNLDDHVSESELPQSVGLETVSHDEHSFTFSTEETRKQECFQTDELQSCPGYVPNTHLLSSVERNSDALDCPSCEGSASPSVNGLTIGIKSPSQLFSASSPHHCRTPSESSIGYFDDIMHNQINASSEMLYTPASTGYIIDSSAGENLPCNFPLKNELPTYNAAD